MRRARRRGSRNLALIVGGIAFAAACAAPPAQQSADTAAVGDLAAAVRELITPAGLEVHAAAIVEHERPSGSPGELAAIDYIVETLTRAGVAVEVHDYQAYASTPISASIEVPGTDFAPQAITYSFSASALGLEAPLVDVGSLRDLPALEVGTGEHLVLAGEIDAPGSAADGFSDVSGAIALVTGNPSRRYRG